VIEPRVTGENAAVNSIDSPAGIVAGSGGTPVREKEGAVPLIAITVTAAGAVPRFAMTSETDADLPPRPG